MSHRITGSDDEFIVGSMTLDQQDQDDIEVMELHLPEFDLPNQHPPGTSKVAEASKKGFWGSSKKEKTPKKPTSQSLKGRAAKPNGASPAEQSKGFGKTVLGLLSRLKPGKKPKEQEPKLSLETANSSNPKDQQLEQIEPRVWDVDEIMTLNESEQMPISSVEAAPAEMPVEELRRQRDKLAAEIERDLQELREIERREKAEREAAQSKPAAAVVQPSSSSATVPALTPNGSAVLPALSLIPPSAPAKKAIPSLSPPPAAVVFEPILHLQPNHFAIPQNQPAPTVALPKNGKGEEPDPFATIAQRQKTPSPVQVAAQPVLQPAAQSLVALSVATPVPKALSVQLPPASLPQAQEGPFSNSSAFAQPADRPLNEYQKIVGKAFDSVEPTWQARLAAARASINQLRANPKFQQAPRETQEEHVWSLCREYYYAILKAEVPKTREAFTRGGEEFAQYNPTEQLIALSAFLHENAHAHSVFPDPKRELYIFALCPQRGRYHRDNTSDCRGEELLPIIALLKNHNRIDKANAFAAAYDYLSGSSAAKPVLVIEKPKTDEVRPEPRAVSPQPQAVSSAEPVTPAVEQPAVPVEPIVQPAAAAARAQTPTNLRDRAFSAAALHSRIPVFTNFHVPVLPVVKEHPDLEEAPAVKLPKKKADKKPFVMASQRANYEERERRKAEEAANNKPESAKKPERRQASKPPIASSSSSGPKKSLLEELTDISKKHSDPIYDSEKAQPTVSNASKNKKKKFIAPGGPLGCMKHAAKSNTTPVVDITKKPKKKTGTQSKVAAAWKNTAPAASARSVQNNSSPRTVQVQPQTQTSPAPAARSDVVVAQPVTQPSQTHAAQSSVAVAEPLNKPSLQLEQTSQVDAEADALLQELELEEMEREIAKEIAQPKAAVAATSAPAAPLSDRVSSASTGVKVDPAQAMQKQMQEDQLKLAETEARLRAELAAKEAAKPNSSNALFKREETTKMFSSAPRASAYPTLAGDAPQPPAPNKPMTSRPAAAPRPPLRPLEADLTNFVKNLNGKNLENACDAFAFMTFGEQAEMSLADKFVHCERIFNILQSNPDFSKGKFPDVKRNFAQVRDSLYRLIINQEIQKCQEAFSTGDPHAYLDQLMRGEGVWNNGNLAKFPLEEKPRNPMRMVLAVALCQGGVLPYTPENFRQCMGLELFEQIISAEKAIQIAMKNNEEASIAQLQSKWQALTIVQRYLRNAYQEDLNADPRRKRKEKESILEALKAPKAESAASASADKPAPKKEETKKADLQELIGDDDVESSRPAGKKSLGAGAPTSQLSQLNMGPVVYDLNWFKSLQHGEWFRLFDNLAKGVKGPREKGLEKLHDRVPFALYEIMFPEVYAAILKRAKGNTQNFTVQDLDRFEPEAIRNKLKEEFMKPYMESGSVFQQQFMRDTHSMVANYWKKKRDEENLEQKMKVFCGKKGYLEALLGNVEFLDELAAAETIRTKKSHDRPWAEAQLKESEVDIDVDTFFMALTNWYDKLDRENV